MKKVILSFAMIFALGVASISAQVENKAEVSTQRKTRSNDFALRLVLLLVSMSVIMISMR